MKSIHKLILFALVAFSLTMASCAGTRVSAGMGVNVNFGPNGPRVVPNLNVDVYNGGYMGRY